MTLRTGHIRQAVRDHVEGATGPYASRLARLFTYNIEDGVYQPNATVPLGEKPAYDVVIGDMPPNQASPVGVSGSYRLVNVPITIRFATKLPMPVLQSDPPQTDHEIRDEISGTIVDRLDLIAQSLATPNTVTTTAAGEATGIVSGLLRSPSGEGFPEVSDGLWDWGPGRRVIHEIRARAIVRIDRP